MTIVLCKEWLCNLPVTLRAKAEKLGALLSQKAECDLTGVCTDAGVTSAWCMRQGVKGLNIRP